MGNPVMLFICTLDNKMFYKVGADFEKNWDCERDLGILINKDCERDLGTLMQFSVFFENLQW